jgi:hypothetical protein
LRLYRHHNKYPGNACHFHDDYGRGESNHRLCDPAAQASTSLRASIANKFLTIDSAQ